MRIADLDWGQVEAYLHTDDRCVLPLGCTEQHAFLSLATDAILAERVSVEAAEPLGIPVFPVIPYGITPFFMAYPGTVTISPETYERFLLEVLASLRRHGFKRILIVNGHGGNAPARPTAEAWGDRREGVAVRWHDWWKGERVMDAVRAVDPDASHASWMESFPWTRVAGATPPKDPKPKVDLRGTSEISPSRFRELLGDGSFGGFYERRDVEADVWRIAVEETRDLLTAGW